jgi:CRISPR-associated endonuclease Csn1
MDRDRHKQPHLHAGRSVEMISPKASREKQQECVWAFDLGKGSIGEAVRQELDFPHKASLLIPAELARRGPAAVSGTPANRYRAMKTREAHHERERWLETIWKAAGLTPLDPREVWENPATGKWELKHKADYRLEREFAPKIGEKTKDGAPTDEAGVAICYTSCLLRIRLLQGDTSLAEWQLYKALRAALQRRGYGRVPWAAKEARKQGKTPEELQQEEEKKLQQADPRYRDAVGKWPEFKRSVPAEFHFPCYYDALKMGLWNPADPCKLLERASHLADSTRNIRLDRADVRAELVTLGDRAAAILPALRDAFARWQRDGWKYRHPVTGAELTYPVLAKTFGEFLCDGPPGKPDETSFEAFLNQRQEADVRRGSFEEWMAALGQKTPSFDNRILNNCVLIPRYHVCKVDVRFETDNDGKPTGKLLPESLLASEVTFLLKLKNLLVTAVPFGQRKLTVEEIRAIFDYAHRQLKALKLVTAEGELTKNWPGKVADCFSLTHSEWGKDRALGKLRLRPMPGHEEVKAPKPSGRSAYSRVALRILKEMILSGDAPSAFHTRLLRRDAELLRRLGSSPEKPLALFDDSTAADAQQRKREDTANRQRGLLVSELRFLLQMRRDLAGADSWENIFIPSQTLDALQQRHTDNGTLDVEAAIRDLLGTINDPVVRHRLEVFAKRLKKLQHGDKKENLAGFGVPDAIVLEFVREDFMGEQAKRDYQKFINDREKERKAAREEAEKLGLESKSSGLRYELFKAQGCICLYTGKPLAETKLDEYEIDHIVPRSLGGPDAAVNYVLTFHDINNTKEKGKLTPFALLHGKDGWDAYVKRVDARASTLRNKKVQLLTREDAPELVERYTALAETAWVSKLAQTILNLHFGWTNGYDDKRQKRVIVVSGGLTARVRRKYGLDKLLYSDVTDPEVLAKKVKNREDKRHHALDAMVLTFIPQWARDPDKEGFFRFPAEFRDTSGREDYQRVRELFQNHIAQVMPRHLSYERPILADTLYGARGEAGKEVIVQRSVLRGLAYKQEQMKLVFSLKYAASQIEAIRDERIKRELKKFIATEPDKPAWEAFCHALENGKQDSLPGIKILKVTLNRGESFGEFKDLSKDGKGAYRTKKKEHRGQFVYLDSKGRPHVQAVRVFESLSTVKAELEGKREGIHIIGFFQSMCLVELEKPVTHGKVTLQPGVYQLNTIKKDGRAQLTSASGVKSPEIGLVKLLPAGFKRKS